jgi:hypothetical protein
VSADEQAERRRQGARRLAREGASRRNLTGEQQASSDDTDSSSDDTGSSSSSRRTRSASSVASSAREATTGSFRLNPSKVQARKMVLVSIALLAVLSVYRDRKTTTPQGTYRTLWGVGVVGMFLSLLADFVPQIAGPFAALIVLGSLTNGGEQALAKVLGVIAVAPGAGGKPPSSAKPSAPSSAAPPGVQGPQTTQPTGANK